MSLYLADTSAWHRAAYPSIAEEWERRIGDDVVATNSQLRLEILYSAQSFKEYEALAGELLSLHQLECGESEIQRALQVQHALARQGGLHHRSVTISDLIIAASAEVAGAIVWHYDEDFDRIAKVTGQAVEWIAPRGTL